MKEMGEYPVLNVSKESAVSFTQSDSLPRWLLFKLIVGYDSIAKISAVNPDGVGFYYFFVYCFRYDNTTGTFTVPPDGDGLYYFSAYFLVPGNEEARFEIRINSDVLCTAVTSEYDTPTDEGQAACSGAIYVTEGWWHFCSVFSNTVIKAVVM